MLDYKFFRLTESGMVDTAQVVGLPDNAAATTYARGFGNGNVVEIWLGTARLSTVTPTGGRARIAA